MIFEIAFFSYLLLNLISFFLISAFIIINIRLLLNSQCNTIALYIYFSSSILILYRISGYKRF